MRGVPKAAVIVAVVIYMIMPTVPATRASGLEDRLFEAVRTNDLGAVRRVIGEGADPFAENSSGLASVDIAVDKGYFEIAHYLLAVQNQRLQGGLEPVQQTLKPPAPIARGAPQPPPAPQPVRAVSEARTIPTLPPVPPQVSAVAPQTVMRGNELPKPPAPVEPALGSAPANTERLTQSAAAPDNEPVANQVAANDDTPTLLDRLTNFFPAADAPGPAALPPPESPEPSAPQTAADGPTASRSPVNSAAPSQVAPPLRSRPGFVLKASDMVLGSKGHLGRRTDRDRLEGEDCIIKSARGAAFCIEVLDWPAEIRDAFGSLSYHAGGGRAIVRYDGSEASQYHVLFPARSFRRVSAYLRKTFGPPAEEPEIWTSMLGRPKRFNKTLRWRAPEESGDGYLIIEVREIDDLRWSAPPDTRHGVLRLYREGARTVFEVLTTADLLLMQVRKGVFQKKAPVERQRKKG